MPHGDADDRRAAVDLDRARSTLPEPELVQVSDDVGLETLHVEGPDPPIVFVHGGLGALWNPYPQLEALHGERELVAYALAGNGGSTDRPTQSLRGHVADLAGLLDALDCSAPVIHGHSYGTAIALEYAKRHDPAGLVLHGGGHHGLTPRWERPFVRVALALRIYRLPVPQAVLRPLARRVGFHPATPRSIVRDFMRTNPVPHRRSAWRTVTEAFWGYDGRGDCDRVDAPSLVIHGPADGVVPIDVARATAEDLPYGRFHRLERAGHVGFVERPGRYTALLRAVGDAAHDADDLDDALDVHL